RETVPRGADLLDDAVRFAHRGGRGDARGVARNPGFLGHQLGDLELPPALFQGRSTGRRRPDRRASRPPAADRPDHGEAADAGGRARAVARHVDAAAIGSRLARIVTTRTYV